MEVFANSITFQFAHLGFISVSGRTLETNYIKQMFFQGRKFCLKHSTKFYRKLKDGSILAYIYELIPIFSPFSIFGVWTLFGLLLLFVFLLSLLLLLRIFLLLLLFAFLLWPLFRPLPHFPLRVRRPLHLQSGLHHGLHLLQERRDLMKK